MEFVETVRDVEAVVHCQRDIVGDVRREGSGTGMIGNDEGLSDLGGGLYTLLGTANMGAVQVDIDCQ